MKPYAWAVEDLKEPTALRELAQLFVEPVSKTKPPVIISVTNIDLLVDETASGFVFVIQHKWLTPPEAAEEPSSNDARLGEGVRQALRPRDAMRLNPKLVRKALGLSDSAPVAPIEAVTVCRGFEQAGFVTPTAVPVVTEVSFGRILREASGLEACRNAFNLRPDLERAKDRVEDFDWHLRLAGFKFVMPGLM